jgi:hypothetical protein
MEAGEEEGRGGAGQSENNNATLHSAGLRPHAVLRDLAAAPLVSGPSELGRVGLTIPPVPPMHPNYRG